MLQSVLTDGRYGWRQLRRKPGFAIVTVATLAIGIGATTGVFGVVNGLLLRSLPFREPERLAVLENFLPPHDSAQQFQDWRRRNTYLEDAALVEEIDANLNGERVASRAHVAQTSWNFFEVLGARPVVGRGFAADEEVEGTGWGLPGRNAVAVMGYGAWQRLFGGDPRILGATIRVDGYALTIVGIAPPGFDYPGKAVLWKPAAYSGGNNGWTTIARLKPGVAWQQARAAFAVDVQRSEAGANVPGNSRLRPKVAPLQEALAGPVKNASLVLLGVTMLVLLIACADVANLLVARTLGRLSEFSMRTALGASSGRIARQLLIECLLLSAIATVVGLVVAFWITSTAGKVLPLPLGAQSYSILDGRVLAFTVGVSAVTALAFGVLPALYAGRIAEVRARNFGAERSARRVREMLVGAQVTLAMVLLAGSVSVGRAFVHLMGMDRGYDVKGIVTVNVSLGGTTEEKRELAYFEEVLDQIRSMPGVRSASATEFLPLYASGFVGGPFGVDGHAAKLNSTMIPVLSGYFATMGGRMVAGREFTDTEVRSRVKGAVVNERFAEEFGGAQSVVGHRLTIGEDAPRKIVGVVKGMEYETDPSLAKSKQVFVPSESPGGFFSTFVARVDGRADDRLAEIRDTIQSVDSQVPVFGVKTMEQRLEELYVGPKFYRTAAWIFAGCALLLSLMGIYGIMSYGVTQRRQEMGVRMALGSTPSRLRGMLVRQGLLMIAAGAIPGIVAAQFTGRVLENLVDGARAMDLTSAAGLLICFALVAMGSAWVATRQIASLEVMEVLRAE